MEWQPIETAPKDGTEVIVGLEQATVWLARNAYWVDEEDWCPPNGSPAGWWSPTSSCGQELLAGHYAPTHWMPMPEPPGVQAVGDIRSEFKAWVESQGCDTDGAWSAWQGCWNLLRNAGGAVDHERSRDGR